MLDDAPSVFFWEVEYLTVVVFCRGETKAMTKEERQRQNDWRCMRKQRSLKEIEASNVCLADQCVSCRRLSL